MIVTSEIQRCNRLDIAMDIFFSDSNLIGRDTSENSDKVKVRWAADRRKRNGRGQTQRQTRVFIDGLCGAEQRRGLSEDTGRDRSRSYHSQRLLRTTQEKGENLFLLKP